MSIYGNHMGDGTHVVHQVLPSPSTPTSWFSFSLADDEAILHDSAEESSAPDLGAIDYAGSADTATRFNVVACGAQSSSTSPISSPPFCRRSGSDASAAVTRENRATPRSRDAAHDGGPLPSGLGSLPAAAATAIVIVVMVVTYLLATQPSTASAQSTARPAAQSAAQIEAQRRFGGQGVHSSGGACVEHVVNTLGHHFSTHTPGGGATPALPGGAAKAGSALAAATVAPPQRLAGSNCHAPIVVCRRRRRVLESAT